MRYLGKIWNKSNGICTAGNYLTSLRWATCSKFRLQFCCTHYNLHQFVYLTALSRLNSSDFSWLNNTVSSCSYSYYSRGGIPLQCITFKVFTMFAVLQLVWPNSVKGGKQTQWRAVRPLRIGLVPDFSLRRPLQPIVIYPLGAEVQVQWLFSTSDVFRKRWRGAADQTWAAQLPRTHAASSARGSGGMLPRGKIWELNNK